MKKDSLFSIFSNGLFRENPLLILLIGLCPALAVTTSGVNGLGMGLAATFVMVMSEIIISIFRKLIPSSARIPVFIIIIAAFVTVIDYVLKAFMPELSASLGVFIPLIVVNCAIMGRIEGFAYKNPVYKAIPDALGQGIGFTWVLTAVGVVREILGAGKVFGAEILPASFQPIAFFTNAPGGFFIFSLFYRT
jgi:electron transport complex protein RnfE